MQAETPDRARAAADQRHRAPGRPGPGLTSAWTRASSPTATGGTSESRSTSRSEFYDVDGFRAGGSTLRPFELDEVGDVAGKRLVHLQCHFGLDSLSWARAGASVRRARLLRPRGRGGERARRRDRARRALRPGRRLRRRRGARRRALRRRLHRARGAQLAPRPAAAGRRSSPRCSRPGGFLYLSEFHPFTWVFADEELDDRATTTSTTPRAIASTTASRAATPTSSAPTATTRRSSGRTRSPTWSPPCSAPGCGSSCSASTTTRCSRAVPHLIEDRELLERRLVYRQPGGPAAAAADVSRCGPAPSGRALACRRSTRR